METPPFVDSYFLLEEVDFRFKLPWQFTKTIAKAKLTRSQRSQWRAGVHGSDELAKGAIEVPLLSKRRVIIWASKYDMLSSTHISCPKRAT